MNILEYFFKKEVYLPILYVLLGILVYYLCKNVLFKILTNKAKNVKRVATIRNLLINIIKYTIFLFVILAILTVFHVDVKAILTGLGIVGLVFGLALQDMIKDFLSGISIILENQFVLGDTIEVNGFMGEVIYLGLKTTRIKNYDGNVMILSNRNINQVINYSITPSLAIVDVGVSYESNHEQVEQVLNTLAKQLTKKLAKIKGEVQLLGINELESSSVIYRMVVETLPMQHYEVQREIRKQIKIALDEAGIKIPYPQIEVHDGK